MGYEEFDFSNLESTPEPNSLHISRSEQVKETVLH